MMPWADSIDSLDIPNRAYNALRRAGLTSIREIETWTDDELLSVTNFGRASLRAVRAAVPRLEELPFPLTTGAP